MGATATQGKAFPGLFSDPTYESGRLLTTPKDVLEQLARHGEQPRGTRLRSGCTRDRLGDERLADLRLDRVERTMTHEWPHLRREIDRGWRLERALEIFEARGLLDVRRDAELRQAERFARAA